MFSSVKEAHPCLNGHYFSEGTDVQRKLRACLLQKLNNSSVQSAARSIHKPSSVYQDIIICLIHVCLVEEKRFLSMSLLFPVSVQSTFPQFPIDSYFLWPEACFSSLVAKLSEKWAVGPWVHCKSSAVIVQRCVAGRWHLEQAADLVTTSSSAAGHAGLPLLW